MNDVKATAMDTLINSVHSMTSPSSSAKPSDAIESRVEKELSEPKNEKSQQQKDTQANSAPTQPKT
ncbi:MAG: hypothetical protein NXI01_03350 [Gammaproteobacteria bacterium]|nr:hypothetical protein [Gammaproteobacteria bacterium]